MDQQILHDQKSTNCPKRIIFFLIVVLFSISLPGYSQSNFSLGVSGGYDKTLNHLTGLNYTNTDVLPDYNFGVDAIFNIGEKMRVRGEVHYSNLSFTRDFNRDSPDPRHHEISKLAISNLDISPKFDYRLITSKKLDFYASAGLRFEFSLGNYERAFQADGESMDGNFVSDDFTQTQIGAVGGLVFKYKLNDYTALSLSPEYTYFFDKFSTKNTDNMQRIGVNFGVEWKF